MATSTRYDAIVIGSGHNGLIAANYLADAGKTRPGRRAPRAWSVAPPSPRRSSPDSGLRPAPTSPACSTRRSSRTSRSTSTDLTLYQTEMGSANVLRDGRHVFLYNDLESHTSRVAGRGAPGRRRPCRLRAAAGAVRGADRPVDPDHGAAPRRRGHARLRRGRRRRPLHRVLHAQRAGHAGALLQQRHHDRPA